MKKCEKCGKKGSPFIMRMNLPSGNTYYYQYVKHYKKSEIKGQSIMWQCYIGKTTEEIYHKRIAGMIKK